METLEKSRMCRLCGKQSGIAIDIFDKNESHVQKINAILPILVHDMDLLPKQMCHRCSYKLEEFYNFYVDCAKTDRELKSQLSWMSKEDDEGKNSIPMVKMNKFKIKTEPLDSDSIDSKNAFGRFGGSSLFFPASILQHGPDSDLTLPCSQCKCVCNRNMKVNKTSPKPIKVRSKSESENKLLNSQIICNGPSVLIEYMDVDRKIKCANKLFKENKCGKTEPPEQIVNNVDDEVFITVDSDSDVLKSENLNRALRPRKSSVDYVGPKKKITTTNLKANVKNKLDYIDLSLVNLVDVRLTQGNANHPSPIIKLEKVDDAVKSLRTQKNLELFNRRVKELQRKKHLQKKENRSRKNLWTEEVNQNKKSERLRETPNSSTKKKLQKAENKMTNSLKQEEPEVKCNLQSEMIVNGESSINKYDIDDDLGIVELNMKQEQINKIVKNDVSSEHLVQESTLNSVDRLPFCAVVKLEKDYTCSVDYPKVQIKRHVSVTNSLEYEEDASKASTKDKDSSRITTSRKSTVKDESFLKNLRSNERKMKIRNNHNKTRSLGHKTKSKKKSKRIDFNVKRASFDKGLSMTLHQSELKRYCEQCDTSFPNNELYRLHPCYQN